MLAAPAGAQVVRGTVLDGRTRTPLPGVIVSLDAVTTGTDATTQRTALGQSVLTSERGEFALQSGTPGRFTVSAKRVGLKRFQSPEFALGTGESRRFEIVLEPIDFTASLPVIAVTTDAPCATDVRDRDQVAALWDEARTALTASRLALRDRLFRATLTRYTRELSATAYRIQREDRASRQGVTERPFSSLDAELLSARGFMQEDPGGAQVYYAPDAAVLTSPEFLRDHCFGVSEASPQRRGLVGLDFEPVRDRQVPDIRGTFWMDGATHQLRLVEFRYTNLRNTVPRETARGEVHFAMLPSGAWYVSQWFIRMPEFGYRPSQGVPGGSRLEIVKHKEEGGDVVVEGARGGLRRATLTGRALDSTGHVPLRGATVRLAGTSHTTTTRADGHFRLDSLPAGAYTLLLDHPDYADLGLFASEQELEIAEGSSSVTALRALGSEQVFRRLCDRAAPGEDRGAVRVVVRTDEGDVRPGVTVVATWNVFERGTTAGTLRQLPQRVEIETDARGGATYCDLPARQAITFDLTTRARGVPPRVVRVTPGALSIVTLTP